MQRILSPEGLYNRFLQLGFECEEEFDQEMAITLALIISETLDLISDPVFGKLEKKLGIQNSSSFSVANSGALLYARSFRDEGTTIVLGTPPWANKSWSGVLNAYKLLVAKSFQNFIHDICYTAKWIFPVKIVTPSWLLEHKLFLTEEPIFIESWLTPEALGKLRHLYHEARNRIDEIPEEKETLDLIERLIELGDVFHQQFASDHKAPEDKSFIEYLRSVERTLEIHRTVHGGAF